MKDLNYTKLEMQTYLKLNNTSTEGARTLFKYRTRMAQYGENFRGNTGPVNCPLCGVHLDSQIMAFNNCQVVKQNIVLEGNYSDIFRPEASTNLVKTLINIDKFREETLNDQL